MAQTLPASHVDLFTRAPFAVLVTLAADGRPSMAFTWCDYDGERLLVNVSRDDASAVNAALDSRVALIVVDCSNPYRYLEIDGRVVDMTEEGADEQLDAQARKYLGQDRYPFRAPGETRVVLGIAVEKAVEHG